METWSCRVLVLCSLLAVAAAHREHKVHNIVLYPDKHSWCKTTPIKQVVAFPGCSSVEIDNNVCVGACFSYSIPRTSPAAPGELIKPYCDSCQPSDVRWQHVTLECEDVDKLQKRVQIINNCSCSSCEQIASPVQPLGGSGDGEIGTDHKPSLPDVGDLIDLNKGPAPGSTGGETDMGEKILHLLRQLGEGESLDEVAVKELLKQADHKLNTATLEDRDHIKVNLEKLRHELSHHRHHHPQHDPTLDVAPHHFKPALEGSELSYQDNPAQQDDNDY